METINDRIRIAREKKGWNQSELAAVMGVKPQTVQQWEAMKTSPRPNKIEALANALLVTQDWLLTGRDLPVPPPSDATTLTPQERVWLELFRELTDKQKSEAVRSLEAQKQQNDIDWEELSKVKARKAQ